MPPLITREEALRLGEIEDHAEIEALVERAWEARVERFADSTDMCSLVNAKSGGCAEDCGFCAQSRFAEARDADARDDGARSRSSSTRAPPRRRAPTASAWSRRARDCPSATSRRSSRACGWSPSRPTSSAAPRSDTCPRRARRRLREAGIQRVHHNVETAESYYDEVSSTVRYEGRLRTIQAVREAGLETCVGGILNLGESREQRVEMAFELAAIDPTSVPINLLNPRPGTKFGDREYMDPWEAVKWIAIFRLILPEALFRLCGGRVENLGELQPLAVKAGINGVMMGNFLTTLGNEPEDDRAMFEELGLNVARQPDNGANPRPDNRSGWLDGETPDVVEELLAAATDRVRRRRSGRRRRSALKVRLWDPSTQLRFKAKRTVPPRPDGAPNRVPARAGASRSAETTRFRCRLGD